MTCLSGEMKASGQAYCWPVDCLEELLATDEPGEPTDKPKQPSPEDLCDAAKNAFATSNCKSIICNDRALNSIGGCDKKLADAKDKCDGFDVECPEPPKPSRLISHGAFFYAY